MIGALLSFLVYLLFVGLIVGVLLYVINVLPLPAPFGQIARVVIVVIACLVVILLMLDLLGIVGSPYHPMLR